MKIQRTNISMIRGDSEGLGVVCHDENGTPIPLVPGDTLYFTVKKNTNTEVKILQKVITTFINGEAIISISPEDTKEISTGTYYYDIQLNRANGLVKTIVPPSTFTLEPEVTYE